MIDIKKIVLITAVAALAIGATGAYFSDSEVLTGNSFSSGSLDLVLSPETSPVLLENMKPGDSIQKIVDLQNAGTLDIGSLKLSFDNISDPNGLLSQMDVNITYIANAGTENESVTTLDTVKADSISGLELISSDSSYLKGSNQGRVEINFTLLADAGNEYQGLTSTFDMTFAAEQSR